MSVMLYRAAYSSASATTTMASLPRGRKIEYPISLHARCNIGHRPLPGHEALIFTTEPEPTPSIPFAQGLRTMPFFASWGSFGNRMTDIPAKLIDAALALAQAGSWESVRLPTVAQEAGVSLAELRVHFRCKDDIAAAWFDRADHTMCEAADAPAFSGLSVEERYARLVAAWIEALSTHERVSRQMILAALEPGHLHIQCAGVLRISRTVQLLRDAAGYTTTGPLRALAELRSTGLFLAALGRWLWRGSNCGTRARCPAICGPRKE